MNPPPALLGAMNRERKPFTYTPGGLDLSEIKSERMAKRLMRNAMNPGVSDVPVQQVQSPPANPIAVPNFNCLPVQVFPTINLPANPKSLLRTRSNPDSQKEPIQKTNPPSQIPKPTKAFNNSTPLLPSNNNNFVYQRPISMYDQTATKNGINDFTRTSYGSNETASIPILPEICYDAEYFETTPINNSITNENPTLFLNNVRESSNNANGFSSIQTITDSGQSKTNAQNDINVNKDRILSVQCTDHMNIKSIIKDDDNTKELYNELQNVAKQESDNLKNNDISVEALNTVTIAPILPSTLIEEKPTLDDEQKEVKILKKQVKKEIKSDIRNGDQNGDTSEEAELTVKLPAKKSAAKTETNVEVVKQQLPDGSVKEIKTTTTKTTVDGKTTIATKTETKIIPKEEEEEVEEEVEEEEEEEQGEVVVQETNENANKNGDVVEIKNNKAVENGVSDKIITREERSESKTTKKVTIVQSQESEEEDEVEEVEEEEETEEVKVNADKQDKKAEVEVEDEEETETNESIVEKQNVVTEKKEVVEEEDEEEDEEEEENITNSEEKGREINTKTDEDDQKEEEEEVVEEEDETVEKKEEKPVDSVPRQDTKDDEESEYTEEEYESEKEEVTQTDSKVMKETASEKTEPQNAEDSKEEIEPQPAEDTTKEPLPPSSSQAGSEPTPLPCSEPVPQAASQPEPQRVPPREPSIPLEKVEDIEIKPIGPVHETITKSHSENTEIIRTERPGTGPLSTQTEYNRVENIVTVNRTTKTLDQSYENLTQHGVPTVKTYFAPSRERVSTSPQPSKPFQPTYSPSVNQPPERRHSLLLERLSMERQMPTSDIYQNNYQYQTQTLEQQNQWSQEPQAEVLTVSNVKPSTITNQQWYQQSKKDNIIYNNTTPAAPVNQPWNQAPIPQASPQPQQQPQYQPLYTESNLNSNYQQNEYQSYKPKPAQAWGSSLNTDPISTSPSTQPNQYTSSFLNKHSKTESIHNTTQQYSSSYVPPPWEQDSNYADFSSQIEYQPPPSAPYSPSVNQGWTPAPPKSKFTKPPPTSYIPPAPNQSFVKPVSNMEPPRVPGKKTYYSEYERRYITVPESTYIPGESKFQPQPDPSPQYYYDNNEPSEPVEPQWRKELREFTEKTSQTHYSEHVSVKPPWEEDPKYVKSPASTYTPTPTWSQTLRPRSWRERSFESEYVGTQNASKSNTLGRGRPLSSYGRSNVESIPERPRGVSVDRYNPNSYQPPMAAEHPPVQTHVLNVVPPAKGYHNPNVPAYHSQSRASAEPREQSAMYPQPRQWKEARASPIQSRSFKYLQWITGTEN
ncbi:hypothetical protein ACJJTC_013273 [Scirpophaga incertulas]